MTYIQLTVSQNYTNIQAEDEKKVDIVLQVFISANEYDQEWQHDTFYIGNLLFSWTNIFGFSLPWTSMDPREHIEVAVLHFWANFWNRWLKVHTGKTGPLLQYGSFIPREFLEYFDTAENISILFILLISAIFVTDISRNPLRNKNVCFLGNISELIHGAYVKLRTCKTEKETKKLG